MRPYAAVEPGRTGEHGPTTRPWPENAIGGAGRRPADRATATVDPLGNLAPDEGG